MWASPASTRRPASLNFKLTARDGRGGINSATTQLVLAPAAGPFLVTSPNTAVTLDAGSAQTVTWSVANTNVAPVNTANVKITLSADGGKTWPYVLAASVPNSGSASVTLPALATTAGPHQDRGNQQRLLRRLECRLHDQAGRRRQRRRRGRLRRPGHRQGLDRQAHRPSRLRCPRRPDRRRPGRRARPGLCVAAPAEGDGLQLIRHPDPLRPAGRMPSSGRSLPNTTHSKDIKK